MDIVKNLILCFEFDGCLYHGCDEEGCKISTYDINPVSGKSMEYLKIKLWQNTVLLIF